jgi:hypothetical protein
MTLTPVESHAWPRFRFWLAIVLVFVFQLACIYLLSAHVTATPRKSYVAPIVFLASNSTNELLALSDPTLFALPHRQGFSGPAWLQVPPVEFHPGDWTEPPRWLPMSVLPLANLFAQFVATNNFVSFQLAAKPEPELTLPDVPITTPLVTNSTLRVEGDLARRKLISPLALLVQAHPDILTNSVVQILVDARGHVVSPPLLLPPGSGLTEADQTAVRLARRARFEPLNVPRHGATNLAENLTLGTMIFEWFTAATNAPAAAP